MRPQHTSTDTLEKLLPDKIADNFSIQKLLSINHHNAVFQAISKNSNKNYIIKILDKRYYDKKLYRQIFQIKNTFLLLPEEYFLNHEFCYFLYPQYITLSEWLSTKHFTYQMFRRLITEIGTAITDLHKQKIAHLDISLNNIYITEDKHFLLGDFSSSRCTFYHPPFLFSSALRTGYSPLFTKIFAINDTATPFEIDCLSFCILIYLLSNNGNFPNTETAFSNSFYALHSFLDNIITADSFQKANNINELLKELEEIMTLCDKNSDCQNYSLQISETQRIALFEATLESEENNKSLLKNKTIKMHFSPQFFSSSVPLYAVFVLCGFLFLFSLYHYLSHNNRTTKNIPLSTAEYLAESSNPSETAAPLLIKESNSPNTTPSPSPQKKSSSSAKNILNFSGKKIESASLKKQVQNQTSLQILIADSCELSECNFLTFFPGLKELYLHNNHLNSIKNLTSLKNLQILVLSKNCLTDVSPIAAIHSLTILDLSDNCRLKNITSLTGLTRLHYLILTNTNITKKEVAFLQKKLPHCTIFY